jgi:hypothetical protein
MYRTRKALVLIAAGAGMAAVLNAPLAAADDTLLPDCSDPGNQAIATECALPGGRGRRVLRVPGIRVLITVR